MSKFIADELRSIATLLVDMPVAGYEYRKQLGTYAGQLEYIAEKIASIMGEQEPCHRTPHACRNSRTPDATPPACSTHANAVPPNSPLEENLVAEAEAPSPSAPMGLPDGSRTESVTALAPTCGICRCPTGQRGHYGKPC